eukprot:2842526-Prymnesium_polylepis.3
MPTSLTISTDLGNLDYLDTITDSILSSSGQPLRARAEAPRSSSAVGKWGSTNSRVACRWSDIVGVGGETLRGVGANPLRSPVQLRVRGSACVCMLAAC